MYTGPESWPSELLSQTALPYGLGLHDNILATV